ETPEWGARDLHLAKTWVLPHSLPSQVGLDEAWTDRIHRDPARRELQRQGFRERHDATLRRAVCDSLHPAEHPVDGCDVDHATAVAEDRERGLGDERDALEIRVDDRVPAFLVERHEVRRDVRTRVVDEDVDRPPLARDALEARADRHASPYVQRERNGPSPFRAYLCGHRLGVFAVPRCDSD